MCDFPFFGCFWKNDFLGDSLGNSENDLKINIFLAAVESAVDMDTDADVPFKDPALY